ncbi:hypothetical protein C8Q77DRAFT_1158671 [Trametes polyzona]|nr:hypothetical protein C8Q77DRAFT_1158671 [Trametes polyzona]
MHKTPPRFKRQCSSRGRIRPGRYLALPSLFINIASILHVFNITLLLDDQGNPIQIQYAEAHGLVCTLEDSRCTIKPRSAEAELLIKEARGAAAAYEGVT